MTSMHLAQKLEKKVVEALREKRIEQGVSQEKLADKMLVHKSTIWLIEKGKRHPTLLTLFRLADALKVNLSEIIKKAGG